MRKYIICTISLLFLLNLSAQEKFNLKDCIVYGLANHPSVTISKNNQLSTKAAIKEARAGYLPTIALNGSIDDNLKVQEQVIPAGIFGDEDVRVAFTKQFSTSITAQLDQTIYDQSLIISLRANKYKRQQADISVLQNDEQIIYNISVAYYQILVYRQQIEFLNQNREVYSEQVRISQLQVDKGVLAEVELNKVQVNLNNTQSQIRLAQSNLAYSLNDLKNNMGYPMDQSLNVDTTSGKAAPELESDIDTSFKVANRLEYQLSQIDVALYKIEYQRIRASNIPKLSFYAKYGGNGFGDNLNGSFNSIADFSSIGIKLSAPIFSGFSKRAQYQQAKIEYQNALENLKIDESNYQLEAENAKTKLVKAQSSLGEERENITLAESVLKSTDLQYQKGVVGLTEWLNANADLKEAQNNYLNSVVDYYLAQVEIAKANGTLKTYYKTLN